MIKKIVSLCLFNLCIGCASVSGPPFVDHNSGLPYSSLKSNSGIDKEYQVWIGPVDGRFARKNILGEDMFGGDIVFVEPGLHTVGLRCHHTGVNRTVVVDVEFYIKEKEVYQFTCGPDASNKNAIFYIHDLKGEKVDFIYKEQSWSKVAHDDK
jgi:hypothetical protein